jgi:hypothetical protein
MRMRWSFALAVLTCGLVTMASSQTSGSAVYSILSGRLKEQQISKLLLIHRPSHIETPVQMDDKALRQFAETRVTFERAGERGMTQELLSGLMELNVAKHSGKHDVRWGILLYDREGTERIALFLDESGKFMKIGDEWFAVRGDTMAWVRRSLRDELG